MARLFAGLIAAVALAASLTACGGSSGGGSGSGSSDKPLKIGAMNPYSGDLALYGSELLRGYQLAVDEVNAKGGILGGRKVQLLKGDASSADQGIAEARRLASQENVDLFTGTYISAVAQAASDVAAQQGKLYWDTNALAQDLTDRDLPNFVRSGPSAEQFATVSVEALRPIAEAYGKSLQGLKVYIEHESSIYGTSIAKRQKQLLQQAGAQVVGIGAHEAAATDVTDSILRAKSADPDVWLNTGYVPDGNLLLRTAAAQRFHPPIRMFVGTGDTNETLEALGEKDLDGLFVTSYPRPDISEEYGPGAQKFLAAYRKKYGGDPKAPQTLTAYTGMQLLLQTLDKAGATDPKTVRATAAQLDMPANSLPAGYGVKFDAHFQNTRAEPVVIQWQGGKQVTVYPAKAAGTNKIEK